jgi:GTP-binding protein Era
VRVGRVALVGRPNAGKSSLLNALVDLPVAAVSKRPQTTRGACVGVLTTGELQVAIVDTPGLHEPFSEMNRRMVAAAMEALDGVDLLCWVVDATRPPEPPPDALAGRACVVALNKIDLVEKPALLPMMAALTEAGEVVPVSARTRDGLEALVHAWAAHLPEGERAWPEDQAADVSERTICAEMVREQIFELCAEEVPYGTAVEIEGFDESKRPAGRVTVHAKVVVARDSYKAIVIGAHGRMIKRIGTRARARIEALLDCHVDLRLFVVVERDWTRNPRLLREFGLK